MMKPSTSNKSISNDVQLNHLFFVCFLLVFVPSQPLDFDRLFGRLFMFSAAMPGCIFSIFALDKAYPHGGIAIVSTGDNYQAW